MMRTRSARLDAVRGCSAVPRVAALAESSATISVISVGASSSNAGSMRSPVSIGALRLSMFLAEAFLLHITHSKIDLSDYSTILAHLLADLGSCTPVGFRGCAPAHDNSNWTKPLRGTRWRQQAIAQRSARLGFPVYASFHLSSFA